MYGYLKGWSRHLLVATGKDDWKREPGDESGSLCEALHAVSSQVNGGVRISSLTCMVFLDFFTDVCL